METWRPAVSRCKEKKLTIRLLLASVIPCIGALQSGYVFWVVLSPSTSSLALSNQTKMDDRLDLRIRETPSNRMTLGTVIFPIGGMVGSMMLGLMVDNCGRKRSLMLNNAVIAVSCGLMGASNAGNFHDFGIFARFLAGVSSGLYSTMIPLYVGELAPINMRGAFTMMSVLFFNFGVFVAQTISSPHIFGNKKRLPLMLSLAGIVALFNIPLLLLCPESPRYLFIQLKNEAKARKALSVLRNTTDVEDEIEELQREREHEIEERDMTAISLLKYKGLRRQVITVIILLGGQQFSGIIGSYYYSQKIYKMVCGKEIHGFYMNLLVTCFLLVVGGIMMSLIDSVGRRFFLLLGFMICSVACVFLTLSLELQPMQPWVIYFSTIFTITLLSGYMLGPAIVTYVVTFEIFLQSSRASAFVLGGLVNWLSRCVAVGIFLRLEPVIGPYSLLIFWPLCMATFIYIFATVPETRCLTFLEIRQFMELQAEEEKEQAE